MKKRYYVIDDENAVSWNPKTDCSEFFANEPAARKKATDLANSEPGKTYYVCETTMFAVCKVESAKIQIVE